jgi:hypothetical protein
LYAKNVNPDNNVINLTPFVIGVPTKTNWGYTPSNDDPETKAAAAQARVLTDLRGLTGPDLVATFMERQVLPLANCTHKIGLMSGPRDPTRFSTKPLSKDRIRERVNIISKSDLPED